MWQGLTRSFGLSIHGRDGGAIPLLYPDGRLARLRPPKGWAVGAGGRPGRLVRLYPEPAGRQFRSPNMAWKRDWHLFGRPRRLDSLWRHHACERSLLADLDDGVPAAHSFGACGSDLSGEEHSDPFRFRRAGVELGDPHPADRRHGDVVAEAAAEARRALTDFLGLSIGTKDAAPLAARLLDRYGSVGAILCEITEGDCPLLRDAPQIMLLLRGARRLMLCSLKADFTPSALAHPQAVIDYMRISMAFPRQERARVLYLDAGCQLIVDEVVNIGSAGAVWLPLTNIVRRAFMLDASGLFLIHNHPSGDPTPSIHDRHATDMLAERLAALEIIFHDHLIVGRSGWVSFRALGWLGTPRTFTRPSTGLRE